MISVPRSCIDMITYQHDRGQLINPSVCVKIEYRGYEISIACDSSLGPGNLSRSDIRVYSENRDVTSVFFPEADYSTVVYGHADNLKLAFTRIDEHLGG